MNKNAAQKKTLRRIDREFSRNNAKKGASKHKLLKVLETAYIGDKSPIRFKYPVSKIVALWGNYPRNLDADALYDVLYAINWCEAWGKSLEDYKKIPWGIEQKDSENDGNCLI